MPVYGYKCNSCKQDIVFDMPTTCPHTLCQKPLQISKEAKLTLIEKLLKSAQNISDTIQGKESSNVSESEEKTPQIVFVIGKGPTFEDQAPRKACEACVHP